MITEIRSGLNVKRFHTTHRTQQETVGHHSANVCAILLRLDPNVSRDLLVAALMHDVAEAYTGDVPAPFKWDNPDAKNALLDGEIAYTLKHDIPEPDLLGPELVLLKVADMMDLILSSLEEMGRGNLYAKELVENGAKYIEEMDIPDELMYQCDEMVREVKGVWELTISR
jgi:5'-deoxynucleotidase YfbR-like HD superfamily hydrolase